MLGSSFVPSGTIKVAFQSVRNGDWPKAIALLSAHANLAYMNDAFAGGGGWTFTDHAVYQGRLDIIKILRHTFNQFVYPSATVVRQHAQLQNWDWLMSLLNENILSINVEYSIPGRENFTLLDLAIEVGNKAIQNVLRNNYQAYTAREIFEYALREKMFKAANKQDWQTVYAILDEGHVHVDSNDVWTQKHWVLLQHAFSQKNQYAILKLLDHYGASLAEIQNSDQALYGAIVEFYDQAKYAASIREIEDLTLAFEQHKLVHETQPNLGPIARPIVPGFMLNLGSVQFNAQEERGIHLLERDFPSNANGKNRLGHEA